MTEPHTHDPSTEAVDFLQQLRPSGPWVLTAILPDKIARQASTITKTFDPTSEHALRDFIRTNNGKRNLYYSVNPTRGAMSSKACKADIAAVEFLLSDLDPREDETSADAKVRYIAQLENFSPTPTAIVDSGNGLQALWRLITPIDLPDPVLSKDANGNSRKVLSPAATVLITDVETRVEALMLGLGSKAGTQNVDRILRLPGTTNLPNAKKRREGRVECPAKLIRLNGATCTLDDFPRPKKEAKDHITGAKASGEQSEIDGDDDQVDDDEIEVPPGTLEGGDEIDDLIRNGCGPRFEGDRSRAVWRVINGLLRRGHAPSSVVGILLDRKNRISAHIYDQPKPQEYAKKAVTKAIAKLTLSKADNGMPHKSQSNARVALLKLGVTLRYNKFSDQMLIEGLNGFGPVLDDPALDRMWLLVEQRFRLQLRKDMFTTVVKDTARLNGFHPVLDYLDGLRWDEVPRIDKWLATYGGAESTPYTDAVGALLLTAAVRRVRKPGVKFDEMVVLESEQGTNKSTALAIMAVREEWFSDDLPLNSDGKRVIEALRGRWIVEAAELSGMRRGDVEHLKAFLSRACDRARMSYDRLTTEAPRQGVIVGTTNAGEYLKDATGNRRFWPVKVKSFDLEALKQDRDQLWAEASAREAAGASIRLDQELWPAAADEQEQRLTSDPILDELEDQLGEMEGKIRSADVWVILDVKPGQRTQDQNARVGAAMRKLGWRRANKSDTVRIDGTLVVGYVKGEQPWKSIKAYRDQDGVLVCYEEVIKKKQEEKDARMDKLL